MTRSAKHMLVLVPITDKSAWTFSKSDIFGIYASKSFFLPTPSPREVFRKRIDYLRQKAVILKEEDTPSQHFLSRGIRVSILDLNAFSRVLEEVFVENEYASKIIGELSNYNIRRMLSLSRRVMTSAVLNVDELIRSVISGGGFSVSQKRFMNALLRGDYSFFREGDSHEVFPVFMINSKVRHSPLLPIRMLSLLQATALSGKSIDEKHLSYESIFSYFDSLAVSEAAVNVVLETLINARLIEAFDASANSGDLGRVYSISYAGTCHLRLSLTDYVFIEQMAFTTPIDDSDVANEIRVNYHSDGWLPEKLSKVRNSFVSYLLNADRSMIKDLPSSPQYDSQREIVDKLSRFTVGSDRGTQELPDEQVVLSGRVDWFDSAKGFGFIKVPDNPDGVYVRDTVLHGSGFPSIVSGDMVRFSAMRGPRGLSVSKVIEVNSGPSSLLKTSVKIIRIFWERKYGFARVLETDTDLFFHFSALSPDLFKSLSVGSVMLAYVLQDVSNGERQIRTLMKND